MSNFSIWMLEYAWALDAPIATHIYGVHDGRRKTVPFMYAVVQGNGTNILLDCGLNAADHGKEFIEKFGLTNWIGPDAALAEIGLTPADITHVILSHAHFDHAGGLALFPNATFYLQKKELASWVELMSLGRKFRWLLAAVNTGDIIHAIRLAREGRLVGLDGDMDNLIPGIDVRLAQDTHTAGSQYVVIRNDGGAVSDDTYVYGGDLIYDQENLHGGTPDDPQYIPVGYALGSQTNLLLHTEAIMRLVGNEIRRILIPHDRLMGTLYPSRKSKTGHLVIEVALSRGQVSRV